MKIDAHHHFWELDRFDYSWLQAPDLQPICRDYLPNDLQPHLENCRIDKTVLVQTRHEEAENEWALQLCAEHDFLAGIVGWVDLAADNCEDQIQRWQQHSQFLGARHITQDEPDGDFIVRPEILRGLKLLEKHQVPFDLLFYVKHLRHAATVARACPDLPLVIDHCAKPQIREQSFDAWKKDFQAAAECENVCCKISGLVTEADWQNWKIDDLRPVVEVALEAFGPKRLMFGSDWPVCELAGHYEDVYQATEQLISSLSADEQAEIWGGTAARFYRIPEE